MARCLSSSTRTSFTSLASTRRRRCCCLFPDAHNPADREILFTLETNEELAIWEGAKLTTIPQTAQATEETGIKNVQWTTAFERTLHRLMAEAKSLYLNDNQHTRARLTVETRTDRENAALRAKYPHHEIERVSISSPHPNAPILITASVRSVEASGVGNRPNATRVRHHQGGL